MDPLFEISDKYYKLVKHHMRLDLHRENFSQTTNFNIFPTCFSFRQRNKNLGFKRQQIHPIKKNMATYCVCVEDTLIQSTANLNKTIMICKNWSFQMTRLSPQK